MAKAAPYEKREDESLEAFEAFAIYRDMGAERSQSKVAAQLGKAVQLMARWSSGNKWTKRCHAYDREMDRREQVGKLKGVEDMRRRQTRIALELQELGAIELKKMLVDARTHAKAGTLEQGLVMKLIELGSKLERLNRGEPGEIIQSNAGEPIDYSGLDLDDLKAMKRIQTKLRIVREAADADVGADADVSAA